MRKTRKILLVFVLALVFTSMLAVPAFAVTEDEVQQQVNAIGREGVTGNIFIWFLCAIGFLKVSQKIDSFMSSLGINVGHTGGSMLAEQWLSRPRHSVGQIFRRARQGRLPQRCFVRRGFRRRICQWRACRCCQPQLSERRGQKCHRQRWRRSGR